MTNRLFNDDDDFQNEEDNLENAGVIEIPDDDPLSALVGTGKYYADQKALAKGVVEKDRFIKQLLAEQALLKKNEASRNRVEEIVDKLLQQQNKGTPASQNSNGGNQSIDDQGNASDGSNRNDSQATQLTKEDIIRVLEEKEGESKRQANLLTAKKALIDMYGNQAPAALKKRASELGVSEDYLNRSAAESPSAFIALFPKDAMVPQANGIPAGTQNTASGTPVVNTGNAKTHKYYSDLLKKDPKAYLSPAVQGQMYKDAMVLKEKFYS